MRRRVPPAVRHRLAATRHGSGSSATRSAARIGAIALAVGLVSGAGAPAAAEEPLALRGLGDGACDVSDRWSSLTPVATRQERLDCETDLENSPHDLRISYLRDSAGGIQLLPSGFRGDGLLSQAEASANHSARGLGGIDAGSELELAGRWSRFSYELEMGLSRDAKNDRGQFEPERRSEGSLKTSLDFGLVRTRFEMAGSQRVEELDPLLDGLGPGDPTRTTVGVGRAFVDLVVPGLPILTLGAGRELKTIDGGRGEALERVTSDVVSGTLWYGSAKWQAFVVSSLYRFQSPDGDDSGSVLHDHFASASFWPTPSLTINPNVQYSTATYGTDAVSLETLTASLGIYSTGLWGGGVLSLWGGYTASRDTADTVDYRQIDLAIGAERSIGELPFLRGYEATVGVSLGAGRYMDAVNPSATGNSYRSLLTFRISAN